MLVIPSQTELRASHPVWGTGGWLPPEQREALDWLTLSRFLGWEATVMRGSGLAHDVSLPAGLRWIILACDTGTLGEEGIAFLASQLTSEPILILARGDTPDGIWAGWTGVVPGTRQVTGRSLRWIGPGPERDWRSRKTLEANVLELSEGAVVWATLEGAPIVAGRQVGRGVMLTLGFHPSKARDVDGAVTAMLRHLLVWGALAPVAWFDWERTLVLRMDDPGGAQNVYKRDWCYPKLDEAAWAAISADLSQRNARMSIGYVSGWVDDGDTQRGDLRVDGRISHRTRGAIYPAPTVEYRDKAGHMPGTLHDYQSEFRGIQALRAQNLGDVELHGYTHMHPDSTSWAQAPDRYDSTAWFREFGGTATRMIAERSLHQDLLNLGVAGLYRYFGTYPTTLICPGDEWTNATLEGALGLGLHLVSSYYLALRHEDRFCWAQHVCAPYLNEPSAAWFDAGLPVVGYFHDLDPAIEGLDWISKWLDRWQEDGARRLIDFRELAAAVSRRLYLEESDRGLHLIVTSDGSPALVRPIEMNIASPQGSMPSQLLASLDGERQSLDIEHLGEGRGRVVLPCSPTK